MGVGGGGLFIIFLSLFTDTPHIYAQGMNLIFFLFSSGSAVCFHLMKRQIFVTAVLLMASFGIFGSIFGSLLSSVVDPALLKKGFGIILVVSGILSLKRGDSAISEAKKESRR